MVPSCPQHCTVLVDDTELTPGVYLALFADHSFMYATDRKEDDVLRKLQCGLISVETWFERWNIKINEDKTRAVFLSHRHGPPEAHLTLKGRSIPFVVKRVVYLGAIFDKRITWRLHQK
jgi:hypothetical protein